MNTRMKAMARSLLTMTSRAGAALATGVMGAGKGARGLVRPLILVAVVGGVGVGLYQNPPLQTIKNGEVGVRVNRLTGNTVVLQEGPVLVVPRIHGIVRYSLRDQVYRPVQSAKADGAAPFQSVEGLSLGVDLTIRYALDPERTGAMARKLPEDIAGQVVEPQVQGVIYKVFTRYTVREIFSSKRAEIEQIIAKELKVKLAEDGIILRGVLIGKVDLPADYRNGLDKLLAEELETEKMRFTLELKEKLVKQTELEAQADLVKREKAAEAAGNEQIIAAKAQAESMKHVLPFKEKQIVQRQLEADAEKVARIKGAEGSAEARRIEASGEADSRRKLADAEAYRLEATGKAVSAQMAREGALISKNPLLIQKTLADKLSDKISVIIAPPPADGGFIGSTLLGAGKTTRTKANADEAAPADNADEVQ